MSFFANITPLQIFGIILLIAGAVIAFCSPSIAKALKKDENGKTNLYIKGVGLIMVVAAFVIILVF